MERLKKIVTSALAFGVLAIPGFAAFVTALGGDAAIMQAVVGAYAVYHTLRLAVDYFHAKAAGAVLLALLIPAVASAQTPTPAPAPEPLEGKHGAAYVSYDYSEDTSLSLGKVQFDLDVAVPGTTLSFTGHFTDKNSVHIGPTVVYPIGPINVFGRHLFLMTGDDLAAAAIGNKTGAGLEIPLLGAILR